MKKIPILDLRPQLDSIKAEVMAAIEGVIDSTAFINGPATRAFEEQAAAYLGVKHAIGVNSGTDALVIGMRAAGIGPGDEVICPSYTFFATAGSIARLGARPVWVDIDPVTYNCTGQAVSDAAATCTSLKAIMPVHLYGQAVDMCNMLIAAKEAGVPLIEDAAQAIGSHDACGKPTGSRGDVGCFSFFPSKNLGGFGDGGMITTNDADLAARLKRLRNHGMEPKYYHQEVGMNSRLDAMQAAVLNAKLPHLDSWAVGRSQNADDYDQMFHAAGGGDTNSSLNDLTLPILTPARPASPSRHVFNQYVIRVPATMRDDLRAHLNEKKIGHDVYYPVPLHAQECFKSLPAVSLPNTDQAAAESIAIPIYTELTAEQRARVAETIIEFVRSRVPVGA